MKLRYLVGIAALAYNCAAKTPEHSKEDVQSAFQNYIKASDAYFCKEFTRLYTQTSATMEEKCPTVIPAEMDEVCQDFEKLKAELKQSMNEYCH